MAPNVALSSGAVLSHRSPVFEAISGQYTVEDVAQHNTSYDCWVIINDRVYDITKFVPLHPGGRVLITAAGTDATEVFFAFHSPKAFLLLKEYEIGVATNCRPSPLIQEYRALRHSLQKMRLFESSKAYYVFKFFSNLVLLLTACYGMLHYESFAVHVLATVLLSFFFQQSGWLAHDYAHHQVFKNRKYNNVVGLLFGNICQGFSLSWWKDKHNTHHAVPNTVDGDPDIDTLPFLAWSHDYISRLRHPIARFMIRHQFLYFFPLLCIARISWLAQSVLWVATDMWNTKWTLKYAEVVTLTAHYVWYFVLFFGSETALRAALLILISNATTGVLLGSVFTLNHGGMEVFSQNKMDFIRTQAHTTRNVDSNIFTDWFTGGLNYQIEHHLFPTMPRHHFAKARRLVKPFCEKHNVRYCSTSYLAGTIDVLNHLWSVGQVF